MSDALFEQHLCGARRIGIYCVAGPRLDVVKWGCVDIDVDDFEAATLIQARLKHHGIPSSIERSKSKGWHVWIFFKSWVPAWKARAVVRNVVQEVGDRISYPVEIFPKQDSVPEGGYGNYVNLPLFGADVAHGKTCFYFSDRGSPKLVAEWDPSSSQLASESDLDEYVDANGIKQPSQASTSRPYERGEDEAPARRVHDSLLPCASTMLADGAAEGARNEQTYRLAIHLKRNGWTHGDTVQVLSKWNVERNMPPLEQKEVEKCVASAFDPKHRNDSYGCENPLIQAVCAKDACPVFRRAHGAEASDQIERQPPSPDPSVLVVTLFDRQKVEFEFTRGPLGYRIERIDNRRGGTCGVLEVHHGDGVVYRAQTNLDSERARSHVESMVLEATKVDGVARDLMTISSSIARKLQQVVQERGDDGRMSSSDDDDTNSVAQQLVRICDDSGVVLFHDDRQEAYASIDVDGRRRTYRVRDHAFRRWLSNVFYKQTEIVPSSTALNDACNLLAGRAMFDGPCHEVFVRIGERDGSIYIDLGDPDWNVVEVSREGWRILAKSPIFFRRPPGMRSLPPPKRGGSIGDLRRFVNCNDEDWPLVLGWLVGAFRVHGPFPILVVLGEHGSAKSSLGRALKKLVDPNAAALRTQPRDARDLMIAASNVWVLAYDNLSTVLDWLSDAFCRLATGGGFTTRSLYTNDEEAIFDSQRPQILNGIDNVVGRSDLLDRAIVIYAPRIPPERRRAEKDFWREFGDKQAQILGAILDAVAVGLRREPEVQVEALPRMADFARWVCACEPALGLEPSAFLRAYERNREVQVELGVESSPVAQAIRELVEAQGVFEGTSTELLHLLEERRGDRKAPGGWPKGARGLGGEIRRAAPDLRAIGIEVSFIRAPGGNRPRRVKIVGGARSGAPAPSTPAPNSGTHPRDAEDDTSSPAQGVGDPVRDSTRDGRDGRDDEAEILRDEIVGTGSPPRSETLRSGSESESVDGCDGSSRPSQSSRARGQGRDGGHESSVPIDVSSSSATSVGVGTVRNRPRECQVCGCPKFVEVGDGSFECAECPSSRGKAASS